MRFPATITKLIDHFQSLPGIGPKTAQRLVFHLLHYPPVHIETFAAALLDFKAKTKLCSVCKNVTDLDICSICSDSTRTDNLIAVVATPLDAFALDRAGFKGKYHVLHGVIDPLNGISPDELFIEALQLRVARLLSQEPVRPVMVELVLATNSSMEGESTAIYITKLIRSIPMGATSIKLTRIARGLPVGGDIEYADDITLLRAVEGRTEV